MYATINRRFWVFLFYGGFPHLGGSVESGSAVQLAILHNSRWNNVGTAITTLHRYDFSDAVELYDLRTDLGEEHDVSLTHYDDVQQAIEYMDEAHKSGPYCGYLPPDHN